MLINKIMFLMLNTNVHSKNASLFIFVPSFDTIELELSSFCWASCCSFLFFLNLFF